jgi:hypothetical protein
MSAPTAFTRRQFLGTSALATAALATGCQSAAGPRRISPNEKLNLGVVGVGGRGAEDLAGVASQNIVALCDVDSGILAGAKAKFPGAATYSDFRRMLDPSSRWLPCRAGATPIARSR